MQTYTLRDMLCAAGSRTSKGGRGALPRARRGQDARAPKGHRGYVRSVRGEMDQSEKSHYVITEFECGVIPKLHNPILS